MTTRRGARRDTDIYVDQAATSYPKPLEVLRAMTEHLRLRGGNPGRGSHRLSMAAAEEVYACREAAATFLGSAHPERVVFTVNTTHALNLAIKGLLSMGDHVLCSDMEHNSVRRPLWAMAHAGIITYDTFETFADAPVRTEEMILGAIRRKLTPHTRMIVCAHASNICSATLPLEAIGKLCCDRGLLFVVDAAQSAGRLELHMEDMGIHALCVPGHKGLLGPQGVGMLLLGQGIEPHTLMEGGNGVDSLSGAMTGGAPEMYEAGTLPSAAIAGLRAGIQQVERIGIRAIREQEAALGDQLKEALMEMPHIRLYAPSHEGGTVLFSVAGMPSEAVGSALDREGIMVRAGFHCSALGHAALGTPSDGAVRISFGHGNTKKECDRIISAIARLGR